MTSARGTERKLGHSHSRSFLVALVILLVACAAPSTTQSRGSAGSPVAASGTPTTTSKRIVTSVKADLVAANADVSRATTAITTPGAQAFERLLNAGLVITDRAGDLHPELAERVPTL